MFLKRNATVGILHTVDLEPGNVGKEHVTIHDFKESAQQAMKEADVVIYQDEDSVRSTIVFNLSMEEDAKTRVELA